MVTMSEVARRAGVSVTTVSHVINDTRRVDPETRRRVEEAIADLEYRRNTVARALAGRGSLTIGLAISGLSNPYFGSLLQAIEGRIAEAGYLLVLGDTHDDLEREQRVVDSLLDRRVDGLIVAPSPGFAARSAPRIAAASTPLVLIDRGAELDCDQVLPENRDSARRLTEHLVEHGHRRIAALVGLPGLDSSHQREQGYREALEAAGIPVDERLIASGDSNPASAERELSRLLRLVEPPTAVVAMNNAMTIGAMRAARETATAVPEDLALAAYDDFEWSDLFLPRLTAIAQDVSTMGSTAVDVLLDRISGAELNPRRYVVDTDFHRGTTCGCRP